MRDRLIEWLDECRGIEGVGAYLLEKQADHLLANGVIVPPVKVGQTVYFITYNAKNEIKIRRGYVGSFSIRKGNNYIIVCHEGLDDEPYFDNMACPFDCFGKTVFLTREEAEKALAKMKGGAE